MTTDSPVPATFSALIDALGGTTPVSKALTTEDRRITPGGVSLWRRRGIPSGWWLPLAAVAKTRNRPDITTDLMARLQAASVGEGATV